MVAVVPNNQAVVNVPASLVDRAAPPRNPLLEAPHSYHKLGAVGGIAAEPRALHFSGIEVGRTLTAKLRLLNASGAIVRMHINAPSTPFFKIDVVKRGRVMPGMAEEVTVSFHPTDLRHYHDQIRVHCESGHLLVPLHAYPSADALVIPPRIDFGTVAQGTEVRRELPLSSSSPVGYDFHLRVLSSNFTGDEMRVEPLTGTVPPNGILPVSVRYLPIRLATARLVLELGVSLPGVAPRRIEVVGACAPGHVRQRRLEALEAAQLEEDPASGGEPRAHHTTRRYEDSQLDTIRAGGDGDSGTLGIPGPASPAQSFGGMTSSVGLGGTGRSVLHAPPSPSRLAAAASVTDHLGRPGGGGAGGGDEVTRALAAERRAAVGNRKIPVKYPVDSQVLSLQATVETEVDGLRIPPELGSQVHVNKLLAQKPGKLPITEIRAAIEAQKQRSEREREAVERASEDSVASRLRRALMEKASSAIALFEELDVDGSGSIDAGEFLLALPLLEMAGATERDMAELFNALDTNGSGLIEYSGLKRAKRLAKASKPVLLGAPTDASAPPDQLDLALQGPERTAQLKAALFTKEVIELEEFEKTKSTKSFVSKGTPPCQADTVTATLAARDAFYSAAGRARRDAARGRTKPEIREAARASLTNQTLAEVEAAQPTFDVSGSDALRLREASLGLLQQGVRTALLRSRAADRLSTLKAALEQRGSSLRDAPQLVAKRSREAAGGGRAANGTGFTDGPALSIATIEPFAFPLPPPTEWGADAAGAPPMAPLPLEPFDDLRTFALRVPRRYLQMGYTRLPLTNLGEVEADPLDLRPMRSGAPYESGAPLPTGDAATFPLAPLPPLILAPKPAAPPPTDAAEATEAQAADGTAVPATLAPEAAADPFCSSMPPRTYTALPKLAETDVEYHLRARPLVVNDAWFREATGLATARTLLGEETISARWRPPRSAWSDVAAPLPQLMRGPAARDVDAELSEDESDTEISVQPPTQERLREIFEIPSFAGTVAGGEAGAGGKADEISVSGAAAGAVAQAAAGTHSRVAALLEEAEATGVVPARVMPVDGGSEMAVAEAALQADLAARRKTNRARLAEALEALNQHIPEPRQQLRCLI